MWRWYDCERRVASERGSKDTVLNGTPLMGETEERSALCW